MDVILLERIEKLGQMGDIVKVKNGFARNFLLPQEKALRATKQNLALFENQRKQLETRNLERKTEAEKISTDLDGKTFIIIRQAGESGQLYGSVNIRDIADAVTEGGFSLDKSQVVLNRPIKTIGLTPIRVNLHPEVSVHVEINVARTMEEAERQARGEDVTIERTDEEEEALALADEVFESEEAALEAEAVLSEEEESEED